MSQDRGKVLGEVPNETSELLPWFLNGTLSPEEETAVAQQLRQSPDTRKDFEALQDIAEAIREQQVPGWQPSARHFKEIMARADAESEVSRGLIARTLSRASEWFGSLVVSARWALAAQACIILIIGGVLISQEVPLLATAPYETLTSAPKDVKVIRTIKVIFTPDATVADIQGVLEPIRGSVVDGPTALGAFTISIPEDVELQDARALLSSSPKTILVQTQRIEVPN